MKIPKPEKTVFILKQGPGSAKSQGISIHAIET